MSVGFLVDGHCETTADLVYRLAIQVRGGSVPYGLDKAKNDPDPDSDSDLDEDKSQPAAGGDGKPALQP